MVKLVIIPSFTGCGCLVDACILWFFGGVDYVGLFSQDVCPFKVFVFKSVCKS